MVTRMATLLPLIAMMAACSPKINLSTDAASGQKVSADLSVGLDGALHAVRLYLSPAEENDGEENDDAEENDGEENDDGVDCVDGYLADGTECDGGPDADQDDGEENDDADGDGDVDDEDGAYDAGTARTWLQGVPSLVADRGVYQLFGLDVNPGAAVVGQGNVRFVGKYNGNAHFSASSVIAGQGGASVAGVSEGIVDLGGGDWTLTVFGRPVSIDSSTELSRTVDPLSPDDGEENDGKENDGEEKDDKDDKGDGDGERDDD